jgi:hypothetical protein
MFQDQQRHRSKLQYQQWCRSQLQYQQRCRSQKLQDQQRRWQQYSNINNIVNNNMSMSKAALNTKLQDQKRL